MVPATCTQLTIKSEPLVMMSIIHLCRGAHWFSSQLLALLKHTLQPPAGPGNNDEGGQPTGEHQAEHLIEKCQRRGMEDEWQVVYRETVPALDLATRQRHDKGLWFWFSTYNQNLTDQLIGMFNGTILFAAFNIWLIVLCCLPYVMQHNVVSLF